MNTSTKIILWVLGVGTVIGAGAIIYFKVIKKPVASSNTGGSKTTGDSKAKQSATLKSEMAVIDGQLNNPSLVKFLETSDVAALKQQKAKLQTELNGLA